MRLFAKSKSRLFVLYIAFSDIFLPSIGIRSFFQVCWNISFNNLTIGSSHFFFQFPVVFSVCFTFSVISKFSFSSIIFDHLWFAVLIFALKWFPKSSGLPQLFVVFLIDILCSVSILSASLLTSQLRSRILFDFLHSFILFFLSSPHDVSFACLIASFASSTLFDLLNLHHASFFYLILFLLLHLVKFQNLFFWGLAYYFWLKPFRPEKSPSLFPTFPVCLTSTDPSSFFRFMILFTGPRLTSHSFAIPLT